jgi:hypothetical protein
MFARLPPSALDGGDPHRRPGQIRRGVQAAGLAEAHQLSRYRLGCQHPMAAGG